MFILAFIAVLLASFVAGLTGFGFAIVAVPILMLLMPPKVVVPLVQLLSAMLQIAVLVEARKWVDLQRMWPLLLAGIAGVPLGTYLLLILDPQTLRVLVGAVVVVSALTLLAGWRWSVRNEKLASVPVGLAGGALGGSTGIPGPPVILFFANQEMAKHTFRANPVLYFTCIGLVAVVSLLVGGLVTKEVLVRWAGLLPAVALGMWAGVWLARRTNQTRFQQITLGVLILTGVAAIASGLKLV
jgi:uncharacterized membrane protein YfcA